MYKIHNPKNLIYGKPLKDALATMVQVIKMILTAEPQIGEKKEETLSIADQLLKGTFPLIKKMSKEELVEECQMWRNVWGWIPSAVKYYAARTGQTIGVQIRNYHRYIGVLLDTAWDIKELEIGVYEKIYDQNTGQYYWERKIVKLPVGQIVAFDWIAERHEAEAFEKEALEQHELEEPQTAKTVNGVFGSKRDHDTITP